MTDPVSHQPSKWSANAIGTVFRTEHVERSLHLGSGRVAGPAEVHCSNGSSVVVLNPPVRREWSQHRVLLAERSIGWDLQEIDGAVLLRVEEPAEVDLMDLGAAEVASRASDRSRPLLVPGSFEAIEGPDTLGRFVVGSTVLDTNEFAGRRCPSEQTALALYRVARLRGGAFWEAVATSIATSVAQRVRDAPGGLLVHDLWGHGESHVRFHADAALLLLAHAEQDGAPGSIRGVADLACRALDLVTVDRNGGPWTLHDTLERDGARNDLVLNTHLQALLVRRAFGRDVQPSLLQLTDALGVSRPVRRAATVGLTATAAMAVAARSRRFAVGAAERTIDRAHRAAERTSEVSGRLRFPGGWINRDASGRRAPAYYHCVNLNDLASLVRNVEVPAARRALRAGVRHGHAGYFRWQRMHRDPTAVLQPVLLANGGWPRAAHAAARRLEDEGFLPMVGWPGFQDRLWSNLAAGTP